MYCILKDANEIHTYIMTCPTNEYSLENKLLYNSMKN